MRYQVPQFIEVEDQIFGPLTLKQFIYLAGGAGLNLIFFTLLPLFAAIFLGVPVAALALALAFYKVNDRPFILVMEHAVRYVTGDKLYLWKADRPVEKTRQEASVQARPAQGVPKLTQSKLKDIAWSLNIKDRVRE